MADNVACAAVAAADVVVDAAECCSCECDAPPLDGGVAAEGAVNAGAWLRVPGVVDTPATGQRSDDGEDTVRATVGCTAPGRSHGFAGDGLGVAAQSTHTTQVSTRA